MENEDANGMPRVPSHGDLEGVRTLDEFGTQLSMQNGATNSNGLATHEKREDKDKERREKWMSKLRQYGIAMVGVWFMVVSRGDIVGLGHFKK